MIYLMRTCEMTYDLNKYRHTMLPIIERWCANNVDKDPVDMIGAMALATHCHIVYISYYVGERYGFTPKLLGLIESISRFYQPVVVINQEVPGGAVESPC